MSNSKSEKRLSDLQVDDSVVIRNGYGWGRSQKLAKVTRLTKTLIIVCTEERPDYERKFQLKTGREQGRGDKWSSAPELIIYSEQVRREMDRLALEHDASRISSGIAKLIPTATDAQLGLLIKLLKEIESND